MTLRTDEKYCVGVGTEADVFSFILDEREKRGPDIAEDAWWPEAIRMGIEHDPEYIDVSGIGVWWMADGVVVMVAPCDFTTSGIRFVGPVEENVEWLCVQSGHVKNGASHE